METLHTPAGVAVVVVVLGGLYISALLMARKKPEDRGPGTVDQGPRTVDQGPRTVDQGPQTTDSQVSGFSPQPSPPASSQWTSDLRPLFSGRLLAAAAAWLCFTEAACAVWFHMGDARAQTNPTWSINWPSNASGFREIALKKLEHDMLRYDTAKNASWQDESGNQWNLIALRWAPDNKNSFIGRGHTPDQCFVGAGWRLCGEPAPVRLSVNGIELPFRRYLFQVDGKTAYVYLTLWDERSPGGRQELPLNQGLARRLKAALDGKRHQGLKKLEISIIGPASSEQALQVLREGLEKIINRGSGEKVKAES
jgi:hypothetical protein